MRETDWSLSSRSTPAVRPTFIRTPLNFFFLPASGPAMISSFSGRPALV
jgi:hypothetical protein